MIAKVPFKESHYRCQCESRIPSFLWRVNAVLSLQLLLEPHALNSLFNMMGWVGGKRGWGRVRIKSVGVRRKEGRKRWFLYNLWVEADWGSCRERCCRSGGGGVEGGWMIDTPGGVNAEFNMKYLERSAEELRDRWRVETEEETDWLSLRSQLQIDGVREEVFGGGTWSKSLHSRGSKLRNCQKYTQVPEFQERLGIRNVHLPGVSHWEGGRTTPRTGHWSLLS